MCDAFVYNYFQNVNESTEIIPVPVVFEKPDCLGKKQELLSADGTFQFTPKSWYIPFNIEHILFNNSNANKMEIKAPQLRSQVPANFVPTSWSELIMRDWFKEIVPNMCMGRTNTISKYALTLYTPGSMNCDAFMENVFCKGDVLNTDAKCGCFKDRKQIYEQSLQRNISLPITCFGQNCSLNRSYKTTNMATVPCNITLCEQTISAGTEGVKDNQKLYCSGYFYHSQNELSEQPVNIIKKPSNTPDSYPFYTWIIIGVSVVLFWLLIFLMFTTTPIEETKLKAIQAAINNELGRKN